MKGKDWQRGMGDDSQKTICSAFLRNYCLSYYSQREIEYWQCDFNKHGLVWQKKQVSQRSEMGVVY